jgi:hypothetical protein
MDRFVRLKAAAAADWASYVDHEFVRRPGDDTLPEAAFRVYLVQDYLYIIEFARLRSGDFQEPNARRHAASEGGPVGDPRYGDQPPCLSLSVGNRASRRVNWRPVQNIGRLWPIRVSCSIAAWRGDLLDLTLRLGALRGRLRRDRKPTDARRRCGFGAASLSGLDRRICRPALPGRRERRPAPS